MQMARSIPWKRWKRWKEFHRFHQFHRFHGIDLPIYIGRFRGNGGNGGIGGTRSTVSTVSTVSTESSRDIRPFSRYQTFYQFLIKNVLRNISRKNQVKLKDEKLLEKVETVESVETVERVPLIPPVPPFPRNRPTYTGRSIPWNRWKRGNWGNRFEIQISSFQNSCETTT